MTAAVSPVYSERTSMLSPLLDLREAWWASIWAHSTFPDEERLLKAKEVQELLALGRTKVYEMMQSGELPVVELGDRSRRVPLNALRKWIEERTVGGSELNN